MNPNKTNIAIALMAASLVICADAALAQAIDFSKAEATGTGFIASLRGTIATIFFTLALIVTGFLAAFNKIQWFWFFGVLMGAFLVFAAPALVGNLRAAFS